MGYTIVIAGKGGTGKTTISALIIRLLKERRIGSVLGIDADPNNNLAELLGLKIKETIGNVLDEVAAHPDKIPAGMTKERFLEYQVQTIIQEDTGFDLLTMGKPEGPGCYCYVNNVLRNAIAKLIKDYDFVVIDNEAGLEHLSRKTTASADALVVISDATAAGLRAAKRISDLVDELKIKTKNKFLIINRQDKEIEKEKINSIGLEYLGRVPDDSSLTDISVKSNSVFSLKKDTLSLVSLAKLLDKIVGL
jgi:CO dehydrogenase maturation factor